MCVTTAMDKAMVALLPEDRMACRMKRAAQLVCKARQMLATRKMLKLIMNERRWPAVSDKIATMAEASAWRICLDS